VPQFIFQRHKHHIVSRTGALPANHQARGFCQDAIG